MSRGLLGALLCATLAFYAVLNADAAAASSGASSSAAAAAHSRQTRLAIGDVETEALEDVIRLQAFTFAFRVTVPCARELLVQTPPVSGPARLRLARCYPPRRLLRQACRPASPKPAPA